MKKEEIQKSLLEYLKVNSLFDKDVNFLANKASMELGIKKDDIKKAIDFLIDESKLEIKNGKLVLGDNKDKKQVSRNILPDSVKDRIIVTIRQNEQGRMMAYPFDGTKPCDIQQDKTALKYENCVCVLKLTSNGKKRFGIITNLIGEESSFEAQVTARLLNNHIRMGFDEKAMKQAHEIMCMDISNEIKNRTDWGKLPFIAVDPDGCGDRDDAICVQKTKDGYRLYVAITDITHYVKPGSPLWNEAYIRATSHYTPTFSVPMFPKEVTNTIFSLDEGAKRLTLGVVIDFDKDGNRTGYHFEETAVNIHHAMTYKQFKAIKNGQKGVAKFKGEEELVDNCYELAQLLYKKALKNNKIEADSDEPEYLKSEDGRDIIGVKSADTDFSHKVIEMFMCEANLCAGDFLMKHNVPGIYRIHPRMTQEKFVELKEVLKQYHINFDLENTSESVAKLMRHLSVLPYSIFIKGLVISKFLRAIYSPIRDIHFGLGYSADKPYTHFTSLARRFSDVTVHQVIKDVIHNRRVTFSCGNLETICMHINAQQRVAELTEREVNEFSYQYLAEKQIGKVVDCVICKFEQDNMIVKDKKSPMIFSIDYDDLKKEGNDKFVFDDNGVSITNGKNKYSLGGDIKCQICDVDFEGKRIYASTNPEKVEQQVLN